MNKKTIVVQTKIGVRKYDFDEMLQCITSPIEVVQYEENHGGDVAHIVVNEEDVQPVSEFLEDDVIIRSVKVMV